MKYSIETLPVCLLKISLQFGYGLCNNYQEGGAEKLEGRALHKIAAKIGGLKVKSLI